MVQVHMRGIFSRLGAISIMLPVLCLPSGPQVKIALGRVEAHATLKYSSSINAIICRRVPCSLVSAGNRGATAAVPPDVGQQPLQVPDTWH